MPQPPTIFPKLHVSSRPPGPMSAPNTLVAFPNFGTSQHAADTNPHHQIFRTKRKHVLKACDRCRVKKTKVELYQTRLCWLLYLFVISSCSHMSLYSAMETSPVIVARHTTILASSAKERFVEMLESHHALVVKALQQLYTHCIDNKCFPGEPIDVVDGYPLTHAILDRLGLIKEAEETTSDALGEDAIEASQYWRFHRRSASSVDTEDTSSLHASPIERSPVSESFSGSPASETNGMSHKQSFAGLQDVYTPYGPYNCNDHGWPVAVTSTASQTVDFNNTIEVSGFQAGSQYLATAPMNVVRQDTPSYDSTTGSTSMVSSGHASQPAYHGHYTTGSSFSYQHPNDGLAGAEQYSWAPNPWNRIKAGQHLDLNCP
ncbi:conserved hypothetical protein [Uncinocarpus reesii 1704]|uniref:C6 transcription factor n=1 Tax=Uncinocarpus reesii (strain UAMH 1704) TaxID=336963 RepID=C4JY77_UNCRE|nr:uncharacterized protein UREG_07128 [Uncinocarpus reesii 1704]EEP82263.1 conserved hypothetical protein [Uncinocarpus reesii 1704]